MFSNRFINSSIHDFNNKHMSDRPPEEVRIKLKHGEWEVEITCVENRIKQVVDTVLSSLDTAKLAEPAIAAQLADLRRELELLKLRGPAESLPVNNEQKATTTKSGMTCRGLLEGFWLEGYFTMEKSLGEVHEELARRGYNYDRTAVSHSLTDMVRENILTRTGTMRNYRYIQKRPANVAIGPA
jgi:hypothetical protein